MIEAVVAPLLHNKVPMKLVAVKTELVQLSVTPTVGAAGIAFGAAVPLPGLLPGHDLSRQDRGERAVVGTGHRSGVGGPVRGGGAVVVSDGAETLQCVWRVTAHVAELVRVRSRLF